MLTGHFAVALAGAGAARRLPIGLLIAAAFGADLVEAGVAALYVSDPTRAWSHSIPATTAVGVLLSLVWRGAGGSWREAGIVFLMSLSHTMLDFVTGVKTVWPGLPPAGLGLYAWPYPESVLEGVACAAGWMIWRASLPKERRTSTAVWLMLVALFAAQGALLVHVMLFGAGLDPEAMSKFVR